MLLKEDTYIAQTLFQISPQLFDSIMYAKSTYKRTTSVRACNFETGWNLPPVLKIVTHTAHAV